MILDASFTDLVDLLIQKGAKQLIQTEGKLDNTALRIAVERNYVDIIQKLIKFEPELCYGDHFSKETPLCVAAKLGHLEAVNELIKWTPDAVEIPTKYGMNVLHLAAQVSQVRIVDYLNKTVGLSCLVNKGFYRPASRGNTDPGENKNPFPGISEGDTPLHIAAKKKNLNMVNSLLRIRGINKFAVNKEDLTALDIVRENTEYHEADKIIAVLASYPSKRKPFLYSAPKVSAEKYENAMNLVNKAYEDRRNTELVVAVLLTTMSFTAAFTIPGGFGQEGQLAEGTPFLLGLHSFRLFIIFDCVAFFLSLFVVLMWQMSTPITTPDKMLFICTTNLLVCATFAFTAYGFMAAMYAMLAKKAPALAWFILAACLFICCCGNLTFFCLAAKFSVNKATFSHLTSIHLFPTDRVAECMWLKLDRWGLVDLAHRCKKKWLAIFYGWNNTTYGSTE